MVGGESELLGAELPVARPICELVGTFWKDVEVELSLEEAGAAMEEARLAEDAPGVPSLDNFEDSLSILVEVACSPAKELDFTSEGRDMLGVPSVDVV